MALAEAICAKRLVEVRNGQYGFKSRETVNLLEYVQRIIENKKGSTRRRYDALLGILHREGQMRQILAGHKVLFVDAYVRLNRDAALCLALFLDLADHALCKRRWADAEISYRNGLYAVEYARRNNLTDSLSLATLYDEDLFPIDSAARIAIDFCRYLSAVVRDRYVNANPVAANYLLLRDRAGAYAAALAQITKDNESAVKREILGGAIYGVAYNSNYQTFVSLLEQTHDMQYVSDEMISWLDQLRVARGERADMRRFTEHTFERLLAESHREVIYVDVWATWCPPCLREMKHLRRMERRLEGRGVKFVSLCVSSPYIQWMLTIDLPENRSVNYWLDDEAQAVLDRYIRIRSFPRFFVLSGGKIVNENVQWPSSNDLIDGILHGYYEELKR